MSSRILRRGDFAELVAEVMSRGGHMQLRATGDSMAPSILAGDVLTLGPLHEGEPRPGQVVAVRVGRELRAHRVVELGAAGVVTRGDATGVDDAPVPRSQLVAVVRAVHTPLMRRLRRWLR